MMVSKNRSLFLFSSFVILIGLISFAAYRWQKNTPEPLTNPFKAVEKTASDALTTVAFYELTIPYLRSRPYQSQLGELTKITDNNSYISYLTNYTSDGLRVNGLLTQPKGEKPANGWPAIVFVHGYIPPTLYRTQEKYVEYVNALARSRFVVFKIDLRGHDKSEGTPSGAYYSADYVIDTLNAVAALKASDFVDKNHIGLWGHSMAGNVVMRSFAAQPEIAAVVIWAGAGYSYEDLREFGLNDNSYRPPNTNTSSGVASLRQKLFASHGQFDANSEFWKQVAPANYLNDLKGTIQLHHAKDDTVVDAKYSQGLGTLLDATNVPHEVYFYPTGGHNITGSSFSTAIQRTVDFYKKYLTTP